MSVTRCPMCGAGDVSRVESIGEVAAADGTKLKYPDAFSECRACNEQFYTREQSLAQSRASAGALRAHEGLLTPDEIRAIREKYGVSQAQLEAIMGTGEKTVVRWERGTVRQSRVADALLRAMRSHPAVIEELAAQAAVPLPLPSGVLSPAHVAWVSVHSKYVFYSPSLPLTQEPWLGKMKMVPFNVEQAA